jgi:hypothetical protein
MYCYPLPQEYPISSPYGDRPAPIAGAGNFHDGVDIACPQGTPVLAVESGIVLISTKDGTTPDGGGRYIDVGHIDGRTTRYLHLSQSFVNVGKPVNKGDKIGLSGGQPNTDGAGLSIAPHLHFGYFVNNQSQNPEIILNDSTINNINPMDEKLITEFANGNFTATELKQKGKETKAKGAEITGQILIDYHNDVNDYNAGKISGEKLKKNPVQAGLMLRIEEKDIKIAELEKRIAELSK